MKGTPVPTSLGVRWRLLLAFFGISAFALLAAAAAMWAFMELGRVVERTTAEEWATGEGAGLDERPREWLRAMFAYYDDHGLPTGAVPLTALLGRAPTPVADVVRRELT